MNFFAKIFENIRFACSERFIAAIGVFDGVHLGHRRIIETAAARAQQHGAKVLALSFTPHPRILFDAGNAPDLLVSEDERSRLLLDAGADACAFINFTRDVAALEPRDFLFKLADNGKFNICGICVGSNWRFGRNGSGGRQILDDFCGKHQWSFDAVTELTIGKEIVSSSAVRQAVCCGDLEYAAAMLGRKVSFTGITCHGFKIAGSKLAAPTANLQLTSGIIPPDGVYSAAVKVDSIDYPAAVNIGFAPTFNGSKRRIEVHLLGFSGTLYGRELRVSLNRFLRPEKKFDSPEELKQQIVRDITAIKADSDL